MIGDAPEPGRSLQGGLLARRAGVHVDFHTNRDFNDLRCFPGHFDFSNVAARVPNERKAMSAVRMAQARVLSPFEDTEARKRSIVGSVPQIRRRRAARAPLSAALYNGCHLTIAHAGALIAALPDGG
jgi:hypothetical protein